MKSIATGLPWLLPTGTVVSLLDSEPEASKFEPNVDLQTLPGDVPSRLAHPSFYGQCGERRPRERERERERDVSPPKINLLRTIPHRSPKSRIVPLPLLHAAVITHHTTPWEKDNHPTISWQFVALLLPVSYFLYLLHSQLNYD